MEKPSTGKDREEIEEEVTKDKQEQVHKDGQRVESEEVVGEKLIKKRNQRVREKSNTRKQKNKLEKDWNKIR